MDWSKKRAFDLSQESGNALISTYESRMEKTDKLKKKINATGAVDIIFRLVDGYGVLPIVIVGDEEIYRGEFENSVANALKRIDWNFPDLRSSPRFKKEGRVQGSYRS